MWFSPRWIYWFPRLMEMLPTSMLAIRMINSLKFFSTNCFMARTHARMHARTHTHTHTFEWRCTCAHTQRHARVHTHAHTHIHAHACKDTQTQTQTHTLTLIHWWSPKSWCCHKVPQALQFSYSSSKEDHWTFTHTK